MKSKGTFYNASRRPLQGFETHDSIPGFMLVLAKKEEHQLGILSAVEGVTSGERIPVSPPLLSDVAASLLDFLLRPSEFTGCFYDCFSAYILHENLKS